MSSRYLNTGGVKATSNDGRFLALSVAKQALLFLPLKLAVALASCNYLLIPDIWKVDVFLKYTKSLRRVLSVILHGPTGVAYKVPRFIRKG